MTKVREPQQALRPSAFSVEAAEKWALERSSKLPENLCRLTDFWYINFVRQPALGERKTRYTMKIAQAQNYGCCVGLTPVLREPDSDLVGQDARHILRARLYGDAIERIAFVDLIMGHVSRPADQHAVLGDAPHAKYLRRAEIIADEAEKILQRDGSPKGKLKPGRILVIGATAGVIGALQKRGFQVSSTDLWPEAVGKEFCGVKVFSGKTANARLMEQAHLAVITGMTLANRTLAGLMTLAKKHNTSTIIWAVSGRNFGHYYTENGVDSVISDPSPFLLLPGPATIAIWRRKK